MTLPILIVDKPNKNNRIYPRHLVERENDTVFVDAEFFDNSDGVIVETLLKNGQASLRTAGFGTIIKQPDGTYKVEDDYEMICCFVTDNPA